MKFVLIPVVVAVLSAKDANGLKLRGENPLDLPLLRAEQANGTAIVDIEQPAQSAGTEHDSAPIVPREKFEAIFRALLMAGIMTVLFLHRYGAAVGKDLTEAVTGKLDMSLYHIPDEELAPKYILPCIVALVCVGVVFSSVYLGKQDAAGKKNDPPALNQVASEEYVAQPIQGLPVFNKAFLKRLRRDALKLLPRVLAMVGSNAISGIPQQVLVNLGFAASDANVITFVSFAAFVFPHIHQYILNNKTPFGKQRGAIIQAGGRYASITACVVFVCVAASFATQFPELQKLFPFLDDEMSSLKQQIGSKAFKEISTIVREIIATCKPTFTKPPAFCNSEEFAKMFGQLLEKAAGKLEPKAMDALQNFAKNFAEKLIKKMWF